MADSPPRYVLDASALGKRFLDEPESPRLRAWFDGQIAQGAGLHAPNLLGYELAHSVARSLRQRGTRLDSLREVVLRLVDGVQKHDMAADVGPFMPALSAYDASYVALAARDEAILVSYDKRMLRVAEQAGVRVFTP